MINELIVLLFYVDCAGLQYTKIVHQNYKKYEARPKECTKRGAQRMHFVGIIQLVHLGPDRARAHESNWNHFPWLVLQHHYPDLCQYATLGTFRTQVLHFCTSHAHRSNILSYIFLLLTCAIVFDRMLGVSYYVWVTISRGENLKSGVVSSLRSYVGPRRTPTESYVGVDDGFGVDDTPVPSHWLGITVCLLPTAKDCWQQDSRVSVLLTESAYRILSVFP